MIAAAAGGGWSAQRRTSARLSAERINSARSRNAMSAAMIQRNGDMASIHAKRTVSPAKILQPLKMLSAASGATDNTDNTDGWPPRLSGLCDQCYQWPKPSERYD